MSPILRRGSDRSRSRQEVAGTLPTAAADLDHLVSKPVSRYAVVVKPNPRKKPQGTPRKFRRGIKDRDQILAAVQQAIGATDAEALEIRLLQDGRLYVVLDREDPPVDTALLVQTIKGIRKRLLEASIDPGELAIEVDSPGANRILATARHFERFKGRKIRVTYRKAVDGKTAATMELLGVKDSQPFVRDPHGDERTLAAEEYEAIRLA